MKMRSSNSLLLCVCSAFLTAQHVSAQAPPILDIELYAGLSITGKVGTVYSVEYVNELANTNEWRALAFVQPTTTDYLWLDSSHAASGVGFYRAVEFGAPTNLAFIPPGTFRMGSPTNEVGRLENPDNEGPVTPVMISRGFWMGKYEVTQGEYLAVMGSNPSNFKGDLNRPVEMVTWFDATNYCGKLTKKERAAGRIPEGTQFRLPTEAEWEYACRAWTSTRFSYGDDPGYVELTNYAWFSENSGETTHPVGQKLPNPWGLYDMHGNVFEWCQDIYGEHPGRMVVDPQGAVTGSFRVVHDGSWSFASSYHRSANRYFLPPGNSYTGTGFRVVLTSMEQ